MDARLVLNDENDIHGGIYKKEVDFIIVVTAGLHLPGELWRCNLKPAPYAESRERRKKDAGHSDW